MATQRPPRSPAPFVTRRSTIVFSIISLAAVVVFQALVGSDTTGAGGLGMIEAGALAATLVCGVIAWVEGMVLAARARSTLWLIVAVLPFFPINSMVCAMFCPTAPANPQR